MNQTESYSDRTQEERKCYRLLKT